MEDATFRVRLDVPEEYIDSLGESILQRGQISPVILRPSKTRPGTLQRVAGFCRIDAIRKKGLPTVKAIVREDLADDEAAWQIAVDENKERRDLSDLEWGMLCFKLTKIQRKSYEEVNAMLGFGPKKIQRLTRIVTSLSDRVKQALQERRIATTAALALSRLKQEDQDALLEVIFGNQSDGRPLSSSEISALVREKLRGGGELGKGVDLQLPRNITVSASGRIVIRPTKTRGELLEAVEELARLIREGKLDYTLRVAG
jgi:ParB/RepB/Spo0J family partition protein